MQRDLDERLPATAPSVPSPAERAWGLALLAIMALLRVASIFTYRFDSDESQHLHVVWGWTQGLLQYRDFFDNHTPLFHMACAPLLAAIGERVDALFLMRLAMLPLFAVTLWLTYVLARRLYGARVAWWSVILLGLAQPFFFTSIEFRTDDAWMALWTWGMVVLLGGRLGPARGLSTGLILGVSAAVSFKTAPLLVSFLIGAVVALLASSTAARPVPWPRLAASLAAGFGGLLVAPAVVASYFAARGAWKELVYCVYTHNQLPELAKPGLPLRWAEFALAVAAFYLLAARRRHEPDPRHTRRTVLFLGALVYAVGVYAIWPLVTSQDFLPFAPMFAIPAVASFLTWEARRGLLDTATWRRIVARAALPVFLFLEVALLVGKGPVWRDRTQVQTDLLRETLALTKPGEFVVDLKGETVFRQRAFFYVLESVTRARIALGRLDDTIARDVLARQCMVARPDNHALPNDGRAFLNANFISVGPLRVAGKFLPPHRPGEATEFDIAVPAEYALIDREGIAPGSLDGVPNTGPRMLAAGRHEFVARRCLGRTAVVWARAAALGKTPFRAATAHNTDQ